jgi:hypothetical protein
MTTALKMIQRKIEIAQNAQNDVTSAMKKIFPAGKEITFKRNNMKQGHLANVVWAQMINGFAELRVRNMQTGKDRTISFNDVLEI